MTTALTRLVFRACAIEAKPKMRSVTGAGHAGISNSDLHYLRHIAPWRTGARHGMRLMILRLASGAGPRPDGAPRAALASIGPVSAAPTAGSLCTPYVHRDPGFFRSQSLPGRVGAGAVIATTSDAGNVSSNPSSSALSNRRRLLFFLAFRFGCFDLVVGIISSH